MRSLLLPSIPQGYNLFTDHNNLIFSVDNFAVIPKINQATIRNVFQLYVRIFTYNNTCVHVKGNDNICPDPSGVGPYILQFAD